MKKYRYKINNLDCANCAREIEERLNKETDLHNVIVNFSTMKLSYETSKDYSINDINKLIKEIDSNVYITMNNDNSKKEYKLSLFIVGIILGILSLLLPINNIFKTVLILTSYIFLLYRPFINMIKIFLKNKSINEDTLITISCIGALLVNQSTEGMMVIVLYTIGKLLEEKAINNSRNSISDLMNIKQNYANKKDGKNIKKVAVEEIEVGDIIVIKKGEKIPIDGIVTKGKTSLNTSALTGESYCRDVKINDEVLSGCINNGEIIEVKVTNSFENSTVSKILELIEDATNKKSNTETIVTKISKYYTPTIIILALLVAITLPILTNINYYQSIYRSLIFLVISCPCAIVISVPLAYFTGIGISSKNGILVKGSNYLDNLHKINKIIFDKTGTLTTGSFQIENIEITDTKYQMEEIIKIITSGEILSNHPIAKSFINLTDKNISSKHVSNFKEIPGKGISYKYKDLNVKLGTKGICNCDKDAILHLNINNKHVASITINDGIKEDVPESINKIKKMGIKTYMFTGDKKDIALQIGKKLNIDEIKYEMLPTEKYKEFEKIKDKNDIIAFVGDGINDAPTLKRSDIGISMGGIGTDAAVEASDIVIMNDNFSQIPKALSISKYTTKIIYQNLIFAISVKFIVLILSLFGMATMYMAVFADTGVTLISVLNTLRIRNKYNKK